MRMSTAAQASQADSCCRVTHVKHPICFVQDQVGDVGKIHSSTRQEVIQSPRACHNDLHGTSGLPQKSLTTLQANPWLELPGLCPPA